MKVVSRVALNLSQEFLAEILVAGRTTVPLEAETLQQADLVCLIMTDAAEAHSGYGSIALRLHRVEVPSWRVKKHDDSFSS